MPIYNWLKQIDDESGERIGDVIKAAPDTEPDNLYIRLQFYNTNTSYKWNAALDDYNIDISIDPAIESRWLKEY